MTAFTDSILFSLMLFEVSEVSDIVLLTILSRLPIEKLSSFIFSSFCKLFCEPSAFSFTRELSTLSNARF